MNVGVLGELLCLRPGSGKSIKDKSILLLLQSRIYQLRTPCVDETNRQQPLSYVQHHFVWYQMPSRNNLLHLTGQRDPLRRSRSPKRASCPVPSRGPLRDLGTNKIAGGYMWDSNMLRETFGVGSLADAGRSEEHPLRGCRDRRHPTTSDTGTRRCSGLGCRMDVP